MALHTWMIIYLNLPQYTVFFSCYQQRLYHDINRGHCLRRVVINIRASKNISGLVKVSVTSPAGLMNFFLNVEPCIYIYIYWYKLACYMWECILKPTWGGVLRGCWRIATSTCSQGAVEGGRGGALVVVQELIHVVLQILDPLHLVILHLLQDLKQHRISISITEKYQ